MTLGRIIVDVKKPHVFVEPIKDYSIISGDAKRYFLSDNPTQYTETTGRVEVCDISEIIRADFSKAAGVIGNAYKIPREYIKPVDEAAPDMVQ